MFTLRKSEEDKLKFALKIKEENELKLAYFNSLKTAYSDTLKAFEDFCEKHGLETKTYVPANESSEHDGDPTNTRYRNNYFAFCFFKRFLPHPTCKDLYNQLLEDNSFTTQQGNNFGNYNAYIMLNTQRDNLANNDHLKKTGVPFVDIKSFFLNREETPCPYSIETINDYMNYASTLQALQENINFAANINKEKIDIDDIDIDKKDKQDKMANCLQTGAKNFSPNFKLPRPTVNKMPHLASMVETAKETQLGYKLATAGNRDKLLIALGIVLTVTVAFSWIGIPLLLNIFNKERYTLSPFSSRTKAIDQLENIHQRVKKEELEVEKDSRNFSDDINETLIRKYNYNPDEVKTLRRQGNN